MSKKHSILKHMAILIGALCVTVPGQSEALTPPARLGPLRLAIVLGNNRGNHKDKPLRYAQSDAAKFAKTLTQIGGYAKNDVQLLMGNTASQVRKLLHKINLRLSAIKRRTPGRSTIRLFYYSGHADGQGLHMGATRLRFSWLRAWLKKSPAQVRLAVLDTCRSGQIIRGKGARRISKEVPLPPVIRNTTTSGMALITSSGTGEDSHELDQLRGSIFTHYLISGLRGAADSDRDGRVTLREAYSYAYLKTSSHTVFLSSGIQHPSFRNELRGHGHLVLSRLTKASAQLLFGPRLEGTYYVLNQKRDRLLAELDKKRGKKMGLGLRAGKYTIVRRSANRYQVQTIRLKRGSKHAIGSQGMVALSYARSANKGMSWLIQDLRPALTYPSPHRTAFYTSLGVAAVGIVSAGGLLAFSAVKTSEARAKLDGKGLLDQGLIQTADISNTSAYISLGVAGAAGISALTFFLFHRQHVLKKRRPLHTNTTPPAQARAPQVLMKTGAP